jgi:hypothetical protein
MRSTLHTIIADGIPVSVPNEVTETNNGFYISYNNYDRSIYGSDTTALVLEESTHFLILDGDHRSNLNKPFESCLDYFHDNARLLNKMSDKLPPRGSTLGDAVAMAKELNLVLYGKMKSANKKKA